MSKSLQNPYCKTPFSNNPPHEWRSVENTRKFPQNFRSWILHRIGRCDPLNLPLWDALSLLGLSRLDVLELNTLLRRQQYTLTQDSPWPCQVLIVMRVMVMSTSLVLQELLGIAPPQFLLKRHHFSLTLVISSWIIKNIYFHLESYALWFHLESLKPYVYPLKSHIVIGMD